MRLVSVNVGRPREVSWRDRHAVSGIYKTPVAGRVPLRMLNLDGDGQGDLRVHGGISKAVYCYPSEHYEYWRKELGREDLTPGTFGENFTTTGLDEESVHLGDEFSVGSARVVVTQPRMPCYKLGIRFQSDQMEKRFLESGRTGFYLAVVREGEVGAGDAIEAVARHPAGVTVTEIRRLYVAKTYGEEERSVAERALTVEALTESWKQYIRERT